MTLDDLNRFDRSTFIERLGAVFEHSPWVAARVVAQRPFARIDTLHAAMCAAVDAACAGEKLALIRAHPQLAGKAANRNELNNASRSEQRGAGLDQCSPAAFARITELHHAYPQIGHAPGGERVGQSA